MRVGMNAEQIVQDGVSGIATYTAELLKGLPDRGWGVTSFTARHSPGQVTTAMRATGLEQVQPVVLPLPRPVLYDLWHTVGAADPLRRIAPVDLVHAPSVAVPPVRDVPLVVTAHDAAPVTWPDTYTRRGRWFHRRGFAAAARRARLVIAVSEFSADELAAHTPIPRERIRVVPNGVHLTPATAEATARARERIGLADRPFVLCVGTVQPRKNQGALVEAFRGAVADGVPHALVIVGGQGWLDPRVDAAASDDWLLRPGAIGAPDLVGLYAAADLFVLPSLHEGFGLPALEAMAQGTPALVSDIPALRETAGSRGALRRAHRRRRVAGRARRPARRSGRPCRDVRAGPRPRAAFGWDRCVERTIAVYEEALR